MSRRPLGYGRILAALACAGSLVAAPPAHADTCSGLSLATLTPAAVGTTPNAVAVGDFNRDGRMDVVSANSGSSNISVLLGDGTPGGFSEEAGSPTPVGGTPVDLAVGDLDRDGYLDLVVALGTEVKVMRRLPAGGFDNTSLPFAVGPAPTRIYLADLTRDGFLDLVVVSNPGNRISAWQGAGLSFPTSLAVIDVTVPGPPDGPWGAAIADFNRDGKLDLGVAYDSTTSDDVYLYFGNGLPAGSFNWANGPTQTLVSVSGPHDIAAGDVDRDGWPDLVTANLGSSNVSVLRNSGGTLLMQAVTPLPVGFPTRVVLADLNQDGLLDLAALDDSATPRVVAFPGTTAAPWFATAGTAATLPAAAAVRGLAVGRFTADGRVDLVTALSAPGQVVVVENRSGTPCARSSFAGAPRSYLAGNGPVSTAVADYDRDGRQDLAVVSANDASLRILRNVNGGFTGTTPITGLNPAPRAVAAADMNVDGNADVVVAQGAPGSGRVQVFLGDGTGGLAGAASLAAGNNTAAIVVADFDGDGAPDVVVANEDSNDLSVFLGTGTGALSGPTTIGLGAGSLPRALVAADLDGDGRRDLAVANFGSASVKILPGNGDGTFGLGGPTLPVGVNPLSLAAADLDGDLKLDLVTADNGSGQVSVIRRDGGGGFLGAVSYSVGTNPTAVALLDLVGGDGKADIAVTTSAGTGDQTLSLLSNNGSGAFAPHSQHPVRNSPQAISPIDADSDGLVDLAVPCRSADAVVILINRPPGPPLLSAAPRVSVGDMPRGAAAGDFDGDGDLDLAVANSAGNSVSLLSGDGLGGLSVYATLPAAGAEAVVAADLNRDGKLDLAVSAPNEAIPSIAIFFGAGGGAFAAQPLVPIGAGFPPDDLVAADVDLDGDLDLATCIKVSAGQLLIMHNNGIGQFVLGWNVPVGDKPTAIVGADFDRDGDVDFAVANDDSDNVMIVANTVSFAVVQTLTLGLGDSPISLAAADFDDDGRSDLAVAAGATDRVHVYRNQGASFATTPTLFDAPYVLRHLTASDVNRDGRPDLVATAAGLSVLPGIGTLAFASAQTVVAGQAPVAAVVDDFNRDGRPDAVVVNEGSDDVSVLLSTACQAQRLEISLQPAGCASGLPPYARNAAVTAYDEGGNVASCAVANVVPAIAPGTGDPTAVLGGPISGLPLATGVASFTLGNALTIDKAGRRYRLRFTAAGMPPVLTRSFTLGLTPQILGPSSVCPASSGTYSLEGPGVYDSYAWSITPIGPAPYDQNPFAYTPTVALPNPPLTGARTLAVTARVDECVVTPPGLDVYFGDLFSISLDVLGASSVCVDCIGGSAKAVELGGGLPLLRQWGYRTVPASGAITPIPGENSETYFLKGANFPGPGVYYVVVTTTPTCGVATTSGEWMVTVSASVPSGEVRHLAASSRGGPSANTGQTRLLWVNTAAPDEVKIRWNRAPLGTTNCVPPVSLTIPVTAPPTTDEVPILAPPANAKDDFLHSGLALDTAYCYSVFVRVGAAWSPGRTVKARPFDATTGPVKWAYATGGTAVAPPTVSGEGILGLSNDRTVHALTRGAAGGEWPGPWMPAQLEGVAHSRSPVVPLVVPLAGPANTVLFAADDATPGYLHAIDARTGNRPWPQQSQGKPMTGAPGGIFTQYSGIRDALFVGTRDGAVDNQLRALDLTTGAFLEAYGPAAFPGPIGPINGTPAIDYATRRIYFASHKRTSGDTLFCLEIGASLPVFTYKWSRDLGSITGSPVLRDGRVYVGTDAGVVYSINTLTDGAIGDDHTFSPGDGPVKGFLFPDRRNDDLIFATTTKVWSISDNGAAMALNWEWTTAGLNPSVILYWPRTSYVYVGSANGTLYQLDFSFPTVHASFAKPVILGGGFGQVGAPSLDIGVTPEMLLVGSEPGVIYGLQVPFP